METELRCRKEVVEGDMKEDVLHRVLYPQVHVNGAKKKNPHLAALKYVVVERKKMVRPGFEPGTFCVLDRCDNQLRHRTDSNCVRYHHNDR